MRQPFDRLLRSVCVVATTLLTAATPGAAQTQGPNYPSSVVNEEDVPPPHPPHDPWQMPEQAVASDDAYAIYSPPSDTGTTQFLKATGFGFSIPGGAVIEGIEVTVELHTVFLDSQSQVIDSEIRIVKGGTNGATNKGGTGVEMSGTPDGSVTYGGNSDLWGETWTAADINAAGFGFAFRISVITSIVFVDAISIRVFYSADCSNNVIDAGEDCDDGNFIDGDCCSSTCQFESAGMPCPDATLCNGAETCDGAGDCLPGTPLDCDDGRLCTADSCNPVTGCVHDGFLMPGCRTAGKSILTLRNQTSDDADKLLWKWLKGQATMAADFGTPSGTTQYALCIHAGTPAALLADYAIPADALKWGPIGAKGFTYRDATGSPNGVTKALLKGGADTKAKCLVKGKGVNLDDLALTALVDPVTVQLVNDAGACFESTFVQADFIKSNDPALFKAKNP
jgi:cysteine-rich repeat protein